MRRGDADGATAPTQTGSSPVTSGGDFERAFPMDGPVGPVVLPVGRIQAHSDSTKCISVY